MTVEVSLREVVDMLEFVNQQANGYLNRKTGELFRLDEDATILSDAEDDDLLPEWEKEMMLKAREIDDSPDWLMLPDAFEINDYGIMERFCLSVENDALREDLLYAIHGRGAFRRFKDAVHRVGRQDDWYRYREQALVGIASDWLEAQGIAFKKDI